MISVEDILNWVWHVSFIWKTNDRMEGVQAKLFNLETILSIENIKNDHLSDLFWNGSDL